MKRIIGALTLVGLAACAQAQTQGEPAALPQYSGIIRLSAPLELYDMTPGIFQATLHPKGAATPRVTCQLSGKVWTAREMDRVTNQEGPAERKNSFRTDRSRRFILEVPGSIRIACPGERTVIAFGTFRHLPNDLAWSPAQKSSRQITEVSLGTYGEWVTWATAPERIP